MIYTPTVISFSLMSTQEHFLSSVQQLQTNQRIFQLKKAVQSVNGSPDSKGILTGEKKISGSRCCPKSDIHL